MNAHERPPAGSRADFYREMVLSAMPRMLGTLDREPRSPTSGSFDRDHWGWHFRDFPVAMLQTGLLPLAAVWSARWPGNPYGRSPRVLEWILAGLDATLRRQHRNGAFDSVGPFTQDHGVTLQTANTVTMTLRYLGDAVPRHLGERGRESVRQACRFAGRSDEDYAFISNHRALFAVAWLRAGLLLDDKVLLDRADREIHSILDRQSSEGWYAEYGGADPGYQSLCMSWLAQFLRERPSEPLASSLRRAVAFMAHFVHPDGGIGGVYGSRLTSLWFPSGFEYLAGSDPLAAAVTDALIHGIGNAAVVTPATTDAHNLPPLLYSYLVAGDEAAARATAVTGTGDTPLPRDTLSGAKYFEKAGIVVAGTARYYAVMNFRRGGVGYVFSRATQQLAWEDAGYAVRTGARLWTSALDAAPSPQVTRAEDGLSYSVSSRLGLANREVLTPGRFLLLRLANLTIFRSLVVGTALRRLIIARLITSRRVGHIRLDRTVRFAPDLVEIRDRLSRESGAAADAITRERAYSPFHMGSARYFHRRDLLEAPGAAFPLDAARLNDGELAHHADIRIAPDGGVSVSERDLPADSSDSVTPAP